MGEVAVWRVFAYMDGDDTGEHDETRNVADWQLPHVLDWCTRRGYDHVYITKLNATTRFRKRRIPAELLRHNYA